MAAHAPTSLTSDIRLEDVTDADLPIFFEQQCDSDANQMAAFPARARDAFMAHWTKILGDETVTTKTILLDGQVAGNIGSWERDRKRLVGYWIGKNYWGKGVATRALREFLRVVKVRPLYAHVAKHNSASIRVLEKCGFTICGAETEALHAPSDGVEELVFELSAKENAAVLHENFI
jgi:RimJ/RimL family protein N-acetyltransferase